MEQIRQVIDVAGRILNLPLFTIGNTAFTLWNILYIGLAITILIGVSGRLTRWLARGLQRYTDVEVGIRESLANIARYVVIALGLIIIVQSAGIDLSALTVLAGAAGVGIGFGLQNIINNFVSGIIILFERPIKVGDRVDVGTIHGDVTNISARSTTIVTNENIAVIVPNSEFISGRVVNWSYTDRQVRFDVPVGVSYASDPDQVAALLLDVAGGHRGVLSTPPPAVLFEAFGDSALNFTLQVWTDQYATRPRYLRSDLNFAIARAFRTADIEIPFPQRDIHIRSGSLTGPSAPPVTPAP